MLDHVAYDLVQVACNLGVQTQILLNLVNHGLLPATKVSNRNILVADEDLFIFLRRYVAYLSARASTPQSYFDPQWEHAESLVDPVKSYLAHQILLGWIADGHHEQVREDTKDNRPRERRKRTAEQMDALQKEAMRSLERMAAISLPKSGRESLVVGSLRRE